jgi:hypothetical protein
LIPVDFCGECKVPLPVIQGQTWLNNGDIIQRANPSARMAFIESENLDPLIKNISDIIGVSIEHLIINISARGNEIYLRQLIPKEVKKMFKAKQLEVMPFIEGITTLAQMYGVAKYDLLGFRYAGDTGDHITHRITGPFCLPMTIGAYAGAVSSVVGDEIAVSCKEISPGLFELTARGTEYPAELKDKLRMPVYRHRDGGIELERCKTCGGPRAMHGFRWSLDQGNIINQLTGRRMVVLGPAELDPIFTALEAELDDTIPSVVIEAQRRFVKTGFYPIDLLESEENLRTQLALRGVGNVREVKLYRKGARLRLDNACLHLLTIGLVQGIFEMTFDVESNVNWEVSKEGDLELEIVSKKS